MQLVVVAEVVEELELENVKEVMSVRWMSVGDGARKKAPDDDV